MSSDQQYTVLTQATAAPDLTGIAKPQGTDLTPAQQKAFDAVLEHFSNPEYTLPNVKEGDPQLKDEEKFWLSYECLHRYLRAVKWASPQAAIKRLEETLLWRRDFGLYDDRTSAEHVEPEAVTGKEIIFGYDVAGRPALYLCPNRQNTDESIRQVQLVVFLLEKAIGLMGPGVESIALMIDFGLKSKNPSFAQSRLVLNILQNHYPERLGRALIIRVPFLLNAFWKIIMPLVDPVTKDKVRFNPKVVEEGLFAKDNVWKEFGGDIDFQYDHQTYWLHMIEMADANAKIQKEKWRELGGKVGIREWVIRGGKEPTSELDASEKAMSATEEPVFEPTVEAI